MKDVFGFHNSSRIASLKANAFFHFSWAYWVDSQCLADSPDGSFLSLDSCLRLFHDAARGQVLQYSGRVTPYSTHPFTSLL